MQGHCYWKNCLIADFAEARSSVCAKWKSGLQKFLPGDLIIGHHDYHYDHSSRHLIFVAYGIKYDYKILADYKG
jgi:hypothetical protein